MGNKSTTKSQKLIKDLHLNYLVILMSIKGMGNQISTSNSIVRLAMLITCWSLINSSHNPSYRACTSSLAKFRCVISGSLLPYSRLRVASGIWHISARRILSLCMTDIWHNAWSIVIPYPSKIMLVLNLLIACLSFAIFPHTSRNLASVSWKLYAGMVGFSLGEWE